MLNNIHIDQFRLLSLTSMYCGNEKKEKKRIRINQWMHIYACYSSFEIILLDILRLLYDAHNRIVNQFY
ncbi:hypothetical protein DERP_007664 [Dermatophagoides pteronyssinus]|uniref:Uncharacterized protein n=1 Tax=Dermatophagoides pteronyssinus TaxID=6956 RepID=A0ABQ8JL71_DERPT|nr:hypothetical protein DERP_007664 [Dermatophagoides pteronyssinus]